MVTSEKPSHESIKKAFQKFRRIYYKVSIVMFGLCTNRGVTEMQLLTGEKATPLKCHLKEFYP